MKRPKYALKRREILEAGKRLGIVMLSNLKDYVRKYERDQIALGRWAA